MSEEYQGIDEEIEREQPLVEELILIVHKLRSLYPRRRTITFIDENKKTIATLEIMPRDEGYEPELEL